MAASYIEHMQQGGDRALPGSRIEYVPALNRARPWATDAEAQLTEVKRKDKRAYLCATKNSWSRDELKRLRLGSGAVAVATHRSRRSVFTAEI